MFRAEDLPRSTLYFPIVGLIIGLVGGLVLFCAQIYSFRRWWRCFCAWVQPWRVTGALHEDGLADSGGRADRRT